MNPGDEGISPRFAARLMVGLGLLFLGLGIHDVVVPDDYYWPASFPFAGLLLGYGIATRIIDAIPRRAHPLQAGLAVLGAVLGIAANVLFFEL
ncbi:MAG: hypothetical protein JJ863_33925 [Deltaproteobacteria bacterium]|nr:hypothetical protein [Deltaproteobacteria bacterium]